MKILVLSCDKNQDTFEPFHHCMEKYWPDHPEVIYSTETISNPYYKTICINYPLEKWTARVRKSVKLIQDDIILLMVDDIFIRKNIDYNLYELLELFKNNNLAAINLEESFDSNDVSINSLVKKRPANGKYKVSVMCQLWNKEKLIKVLNLNLDPWTFERTNNHLNFDYYILKNRLIDWGHYKTGDVWGIYRGKWCKEVIPFFEKEGIIVDYSKRGFK